MLHLYCSLFHLPSHLFCLLRTSLLFSLYSCCVCPVAHGIQSRTALPSPGTHDSRFCTYRIAQEHERSLHRTEKPFMGSGAVSDPDVLMRSGRLYPGENTQAAPICASPPWFCALQGGLSSGNNKRLRSQDFSAFVSQPSCNTLLIILLSRAVT